MEKEKIINTAKSQGKDMTEFEKKMLEEAQMQTKHLNAAKASLTVLVGLVGIIVGLLVMK